MREIPTIFGCHLEDVDYTETAEGFAFFGKLYLDGKRVGYVENGGSPGTAMIYMQIPNVRKELTKRIQAHLANRRLASIPIDMVDEIFIMDLLDLHDYGEISYKNTEIACA